MRGHAKACGQLVECQYLFRIVQKKEGLYSHREKVHMVDELRAKYESTEFSKVVVLMCHKDCPDYHVAIDSGASRGAR